MIILLVIGFALVCFREIPGLILHKYWKELIVFSVLLGAAFILSLLLVLGVELPQVSTVITDFFLN
jgi:hypothetical protein